MEIMDMDTKDSVTAPQNSDFREQSINSLESVVGKELEQVSKRRSVKQALDSELHNKASEYREHSQKSRNSGKPTDEETPGKLVKRTFSRDMHLQHSDFSKHSLNSGIKQPGMVEVTTSTDEAERTARSSDFSKHSQNSLTRGEPTVHPRESKVTCNDRDVQGLVTVSEFRELSPKSRVETEGSEGTHKKQHTRPVCIGKPSEYSRDSLGVGNNVSVPSFSWFKSMSQIVSLTATWQGKVEGNPTAAGTASNAKVNTNPVHTEFNFFL